MKKFIRPHMMLYFFLLVLGISGFLFVVFAPPPTGFYLFIVFAALGGLGVALYVDHTKRRGEELVCPAGSDCNAVVTSRYSVFLGVKMEHWGILYYGAIMAGYLFLAFYPEKAADAFLLGLWLLTSVAFLFSLYLLFVQGVLLRQWCIWCLLSAFLSVLIFIISLVSFTFAVELIAGASGVVIFLRDIGFTLGVGGATAAIFLLRRFLRDHNINKEELGVLQGIAEVVWAGLALALIGQFAFLVAFLDILGASHTFLVQTAALFVVVVGGAVLMILFVPFLALIPFGGAKDGGGALSSPLATLRKPTFVVGALTLASFYFAFAMNYVGEYSFSFIAGAYAAWLVLALIAALLWERRMVQ